VQTPVFKHAILKVTMATKLKFGGIQEKNKGLSIFFIPDLFRKQITLIMCQNFRHRQDL
jgi:hypothetical protein